MAVQSESGGGSHAAGQPVRGVRPDGVPHDEELRRRQNEVQAAVLDALPSGIALLDRHGVIVSVNATWRTFADGNGLRTHDHGVGVDYLAVCERGTGEDPVEAHRVAQGIREVLAGTREHFSVEYPCRAAGELRWYSLAVTPLPGQAAMGAVVMHTDITRRRQTADALAELSVHTERRERLLSRTLSSIADLSYAFDRQGRILFANEPALHLWGLPLDAVIGRTVVDLGYPDELARRIQQQVEHVFATGENVKDETPFVDHEGQKGYYEYIFSPAIGPHGEVEFGVGFSRDVTQRKQAENDLRASVAEFHTLAAAMPQIVWTSDGAGRITYLNQHWVDYTGRGTDTGVGMPWGFVLREHDPHSSPDLSWPQDHAAGNGFTTEVRLRRKDGQVRWWLMRGVPLRDEHGRLLKWLGTCTDIDELKLAETEVSRANTELRKQRTELRALFDVVPAMIWSKDTRNNFVRVNERAARSVGRTVAEVEGRSAFEIYPDEAQAFFDGDQEIIRSHTSVMGKLEVARDPNGEERWIQKDKVPYLDEDGNVIGVLVMSHDITERKRDQDALRELNADLEDRVRRRTAELALARDDAERANQAKSTFLATMSHEIRTPMGGLLGLLELLELTDLTEEQRNTLHVARHSGKSLKKIIDGILDFSKIEANSLELDLQPASIRAVVDNARRLHGRVAADKKLALVTQVAPDISPCLVFDPLRLGQIVNNLLSNALKFTERGEVRLDVELVARSDGREELRLSVRDTGVGIAPEHVSRLFKPFAQAGAGTSTRFGGTGLGLFISRRLAHQMGGELQLESRPGVGTVLTLQAAFTTCDPDAVETAARVGKSQLPVDGRRASVTRAEGVAVSIDRVLLVVDDHPINREVLVRQAAALGHAAEATEDGHQALLAWETGRFTAMLADCNMPGMSGFELVRRIRALEVARGLARMPIIGCTANALPSARADCLDAGMDDVLTKPVDLLGLSETLDRWLPSPDGGVSGPSPLSAHPETQARETVDQGLLDLPMLAAISRGDASAERRVLQEFRRTNDIDADALREGLRARDFARVVHHAHRLRGACSMLGATVLASVCTALQAAGARHDDEELSVLMDQFETELLRLRNYLGTKAGVHEEQASGS